MRLEDTPRRRAALAATLLSAVTLAGCAGTPEPCLGTTCDDRSECLANRCVARGAGPVPDRTERVVFDASAIAGGERALYLRFGASPSFRDVVAAFLLLEPASGTAPNDDVVVDVFCVDAPWSPDRIAAGAEPKLSRERARGLVRTSPRSVARIDLTALARRFETGHCTDGLAVVARGAERDRPLLSGDAGDGTPRLEVYARPRPTARAW